MDNLAQQLAQAVIAYDDSIAGQAAKGNVDLSGDIPYASTADLDRLYASMVGKAQQLLDQEKADEQSP